MDDCAFCKEENLAYRTVVETPHVRAFLNFTPIVPGHTLISPKRHAARYEELTAVEKEEIESLRLQLHEALTKSFDAEGFNYAWNEGGVGGQSVPHFHLHMLPRKTGDAGVHGYEPREFLYRSVAADARPRLPEKELTDIARLIRETLGS